MTQDEKQSAAFMQDQFVNVFIALTSIIEGELSMDFELVWKCQKNYKDLLKDSHFTLGIGSTIGSIIAYRIPNYYWNMCNYATTLEELPKDIESMSHSDIVNRIRNLYKPELKRWE